MRPLVILMLLQYANSALKQKKIYGLPLVTTSHSLQRYPRGTGISLNRAAMHFFRPISYHRLPSSVEMDGSTTECRLVEDLGVDSTIRRSESAQQILTQGTLLIQCLRLKEAVSAMVFMALLFISFWIGSSMRPNALQRCVEETSSYSPALEAVRYQEEDFANAFDQKSLYRGPPTPALEKAWEDLWNQPEVLIPPHAMAKLGRNGMLDSYMKAPREEGDGYIGGLEVFHQLHCLNYIRQFTWHLMDKYDNETLPSGFDLPLKALRMHTDHCIETLRLALMCQSDVSPVLLKWSSFSNPPSPEAEFSSHHRCRNFEEVFAWNKEHAIVSWGLEENHGKKITMERGLHVDRLSLV